MKRTSKPSKPGLKTGIAILALCAASVGYTAYELSKSHPHTLIKSYVIYPSGAGGPKLTLKGTGIKTNGFCVEVELAGRTDTVACGNVFITEGDETSGIPEGSNVVR